MLDYNAIMKNEPLGQATQDLSKLRANSEWTYKARSSLDNLKNKAERARVDRAAIRISMAISRIHAYIILRSTCSGGAVDARPRVRQMSVGAEGRARHLRRRLGLAGVKHVCREPGP